MKVWWIALVVYGAACISIPGGWLATRPAKAHVEAGPFYADPVKTVYHGDKHCPFLHCDDPAVLPGLAPAQSFGQACDYCLKTLAKQESFRALQP